jgi:hypothetical protein
LTRDGGDRKATIRGFHSANSALAEGFGFNHQNLGKFSVSSP